MPHSTLTQLQQQAAENPQAFWQQSADALHWHQAAKTALQYNGESQWRWFADGQLNTCYNCVDRHVAAGRGDYTALIYDSPVTGHKARISYRRLQEKVAHTAGMLTKLGVSSGDRVIIYMPMVPEAIYAMLACARIGAIHSVVFGGFAARELATRIDDAKPKVLLTASCGIEPSRVVEYKPLVDEAMRLAQQPPETVVVLQRPQATASMQSPVDIDWEVAMTGAQNMPCVPVSGDHPLYLLYTSGTTGKPKGVQRDTAGHALAMQWSMQQVYGVKPGDVYWAASDIGWVVGHSYIVYGPLMAGCTTVLYEGKPVGTPDAGAFWRMVEEYAVDVLFTAPTAIRAIKKEDPQGTMLERYSSRSLRALFLAGERCDPDTQQWASKLLNVPVIDHWWQTETGWPIAANPLGLGLNPMVVGSAGVPMPGFQVDILDADNQRVAIGEMGDIAIKLPLPPGCMQTLWQDQARFESAYLAKHPGWYCSGDTGYFDADGNLFVMGRIDDVINVAGHRLSTGAMEEVLCAYPAVAECAVIAKNDGLKGQVPMGLVVLKQGVEETPAAVADALVAKVRKDIGALACLRDVLVVSRLPKTRSGKILRATLKAMVNGDTVNVPPTIDDPAILEEIAPLLAQVEAA